MQHIFTIRQAIRVLKNSAASFLAEAARLEALLADQKGLPDTTSIKEFLELAATFAPVRDGEIARLAEALANIPDEGRRLETVGDLRQFVHSPPQALDLHGLHRDQRTHLR